MPPDNLCPALELLPLPVALPTRPSPALPSSRRSSGHRPRSRRTGRPRLSAALDRGLDDSARLTILSAPPGYGKTAALTGWLESRGLAHAWLSLDPADNDLARFVRYLVAALGSVRPGAGAATADLFGPGASPGPDLVGATLLEELEASDDPFLLVLDDYG